MAALKVRIRGRHRPPPPEFFYQSLPPECIALLATIPDHKVSIPAEGSSWRGGWPFAKAPEKNPCETSGGVPGPVVVYQL
ncbi:MAG: hypothetical protein LBJ21_07480, partial [Acidobacteriota bacterium]|nr:hypothetical protein [Acidobacteriota bacterium]